MIPLWPNHELKPPRFQQRVTTCPILAGCWTRPQKYLGGECRSTNVSDTQRNHVEHPAQGCATPGFERNIFIPHHTTGRTRPSVLSHAPVQNKPELGVSPRFPIKFQMDSTRLPPISPRAQGWTPQHSQHSQSLPPRDKAGLCLCLFKTFPTQTIVRSHLTDGEPKPWFPTQTILPPPKCWTAEGVN